MLMSFIRLQLFEVIRVATMIVRIVGAENYTHATEGTAAFSESLLIAEQVCLVCLATTLVDVLTASIGYAYHWLLDTCYHSRQVDGLS